MNDTIDPILPSLATLIESRGVIKLTQGQLRWTSQWGEPTRSKKLTVSIRYNDKEALEEILTRLYSSRLCRNSSQPYIGKKHGYYRLDITGDTAHMVLKAALPYILSPSKREEIEHVLNA